MSSDRLGADEAQLQIQLGKIRVPSIRNEILSRSRLLEWLTAKATGRVIVVTASAGYGKTTLLGDFSRLARAPVLWYTLDRADSDWATFLAHLVAACQQHQPTFGSATLSLMQHAPADTDVRDAAVTAFLGELRQFAQAGPVLIFDDFHEVDDAEDVRFICRSLVDDHIDGLTVIIASRRSPTAALGRRRATNAVAFLGTEDLRFDVNETEQLFNRTYGRDLDQDVIQALVSKTEGWAASLQMVQAALRDRTSAEIRRFIANLTGADHDLFDYLAEEVVSDQPDELRDFLMRTSILQVVSPELASVVTGVDEATAQRLLVAAERVTLLEHFVSPAALGRRYHPLVREFLCARLLTTQGQSAVADLHRRVALVVAERDWRTAAHHFHEAGDITALVSVVDRAIPAIMGDGQYSLAETYVESLEPSLRTAQFDLISSRVNMQRGDYETAIASSELVLAQATAGVERDHALLNLVTLYLNFGDGQRATEFATELRASDDTTLSLIARASEAMVAGSESGNLVQISRLLLSMSKRQRTLQPHYFAITQYNLASILILQDRPDVALDTVDSVLEILETGSASIELAAARVLKAQALAMLGRTNEARLVMAVAESGGPHQEAEVGVGLADILDSYLDPLAADAKLAQFDPSGHHTPSERRLISLAVARLHARRGRIGEALNALSRYPMGRPVHLGIEAARLVTAAYVAVVAETPDAARLASEAATHSRRQGASRWRRSAELLQGIAEGGTHGHLVTTLGRESPHTLTYFADLICRRLDSLDDDALDAVHHAATMHKERWRLAARQIVDAGGTSALPAARILDSIGEKADIVRLRKFSRRVRRVPGAGSLGKGLSRRLADRVFAEDQGRIRFRVGTREIVGSSLRRRVLALACFLLSRPDLSCTRDQVLEALWPDLAPEVAGNSLNQTVYFLRRVFEPIYVDDLSPGYVHHDSDIIWLDHDLITSRSVECKRLIRRMSVPPSPDQVQELSALYWGRFAQDFEYEDWAADHRDSLHAAYLEVVEHAVLADFASGHHDRGLALARRALEIDSSADNIELALVRFNRSVGAHLAAAERYDHYSDLLRNELGLEPPSFESI